MRKHLMTTVEEDTTNREHFAVVTDRREKAAAEKLQLEHKLKLQRLEMAKQVGSLQAAQDMAAAELADLRSSHAASRAAAEREAAAVKVSHNAAYSADHAELAAQLAAARAELATLREDNRAAAAAARKSRKRAQQDCEASLGEYDAELGARQREFEQGLTAYNDVQDKIKKAASEADTLRAERLAYEEAQRVAAEAKRREELHSLRLEAAAYMIQNCWKVWKKQKAAEARKTSAKGKGSKGAAEKGGSKAATGTNKKK
eukprot:gene4895-5140_t